MVSDVDLVLSIGGDGTLLETSHHLSDQIPVLGLNSDPTQLQEVSVKKDRKKIGKKGNIAAFPSPHILSACKNIFTKSNREDVLRC